MLPLSYQGFGFTTILLMIAILTVGQIFKYVRDRRHKHSHTKKQFIQSSKK